MTEIQVLRLAKNIINSTNNKMFYSMTEIQVLRRKMVLMIAANNVLFYDRDTGIETLYSISDILLLYVLFYDRDTGIETHG